MGQGGILRLIAVHTCRLQGTMPTNNNDTSRLLQYVQEIRHTHLTTVIQKQSDTA
jgi:hypothetical protein